MTNNDLQENQTPAEAAAEDAAFAAAFNQERGIEPEPTPEPEPEVVAEEPAAEETPPADEAAPAPAAAEEPATPVIAGLTEEQVAAALARVSQQQSTIDKLGGRLGQLMQQVEKLKEQPRTAAEQRSFDLKLERLQESFPELAEMLRHDLAGLGAGAPAPAGDQPQAQTFTADDVDRIVSEKLQTFQKQQEIGFEVRALGAAHPDWQDVIKTPQFALWRDNVIQDGKQLMESENAQFISLKLTQFKDWLRSTTSPAHQPEAAPVARQTSQRLANAVLPKGHSAPAPGPVTEEDAFAAAFAKERARGGR